MSNTLKTIFFGDIVGSTGRALFKKYGLQLKEQYNADLIIINGENSADGKGITSAIVQELKNHGANLVTTGNHIWDKKEIISYMSTHDDIIRPLNYPPECPGKGYSILDFGTYKVAIINLMGRVFMRTHLDCPFRTGKALIEEIQKITPLIFIDFHAETTAEKLFCAYFFDGKVSGIVGTHTHVQTADNRILPEGTAYITDLGMGGSLNSMIGIKKENLYDAFLLQMPVRHEVDDKPPYILSGVCITTDIATGKSSHIERIYFTTDSLI